LLLKLNCRAVFLGFRLERIAYLACTQLTGAYGNFLINTSTVARLSGLITQCEEKYRSGVAASVTALLCEPLATTAGRSHMQVGPSATDCLLSVCRATSNQQEADLFKLLCEQDQMTVIIEANH
jgi:hypothetical protein